MSKPKGFFTYFHHRDIIGMLSDEQAGRLYKTLLNYGEDGEAADLSDDKLLNMAYTMLKGEIDVNLANYRSVCKKRKEASLLAVQARKNGSANAKRPSKTGFSNNLTDEETVAYLEYIETKTPFAG